MINMQFGKVLGTVVATQKDEKLKGLKFQIIEPLDIEGQSLNGYLVAVDSVGAGIGEVVMYCTGSSARQTVLTKDKPVDAVIMGIVDTWDIHGETKFKKV